MFAALWVRLWHSNEEREEREEREFKNKASGPYRGVVKTGRHDTDGKKSK